MPAAVGSAFIAVVIAATSGALSVPL